MMSNTVMKVIVIGAGASGLVSIKSCLEENLEVTCYELTESIGGLWKYRDDSPEHVSVLQKSTIINSSKEMSAYSDFPPPPEFSNYMHNRIMWSYLNLYAENFKLLPHIKLNHQVLSCEKSDDYDKTGDWVVKGVNKVNGETWEDRANAVMVCNGHLACPNLPKIPGLDEFGGKVIHTRDYKTTKGYEDQNIVVIGVGNSGGDAAVELSTVTNELYLSTRTGTWVLKRIGHGGLPSDFRISRFLGYILSKSFTLVTSFIEYEMNNIFNHELYGLKPKHRLLEQHPVVNDDLPNRIVSGRVKIKDDIDFFTKDGVRFKGDENEYKVDTVVCATGYLINFPFLANELLNFDPELNQVGLYKYIIPPHLKHSTLATIGLIQPFGSILPLAEAQARWYCQLLSGKLKLPTQESMERIIQSTAKNHSRRFKQTTRYTIEVDWQNYIDDLCKEFGAKPNLFYLALTDPSLFFKCVFGPILPYQFRLNGPHAWPGAKGAIKTTDERMRAPLFKSPNQSKCCGSSIFKIAMGIGVVSLAVITYTLF